MLRVLISALLTLPLVLHMVFPVVPLWTQLILATIVQFGFGWPFYRWMFSSYMDLLIALGTTAAWGFSTVVVLFNLQEHVYFESSAAIITLVLFGRYLEMRTMHKASGAIAALLNLQPKTARVKKQGTWEEIPVDEIVVGDLFQVRPGQSVPIDGKVVDGDSYVDEAMLTGESVPVHKQAGAELFGGTQNQQGALVGEATAVGADTVLANIISLVDKAQNSRAPVQKLADKISSIFVPTVVGISLLSFFLWWLVGDNFTAGLINGVAVLVIACPCALGMATPTVITVATGLGAKAGILIRNAEALQRAEKLKVIAVDKTGTLTEGKPRLTDGPADDPIAASLEAYSEHPIATAFTGKPLPISDFEAIAGKGVRGLVEGKSYTLGSLKWMEELGLHIDRSMTDPLESAGKTVMCLADSEQIIHTFAIADTLRPESREGVMKIQELGLEVVMLTGDHKKTASAIAKQAGITTFYAEILPQDKAKTIEKLHAIGMVGDGINDAPALAAADVGFAMRSGTDIAIESADITLMRSDMRQVAHAIDLSRATFKKVRQNLFFAFAYNALGVPLAALGLLNPIIAGAAMALSSLCVITNSLLLNRWNP